MKTEKCSEMMDLFLKGERSEAVVTHLQNCSDCRELAALSKLAAVPGEEVKVPEELDQAVLAYAAARKRPVARAWDLSFILRHAAIPVAAAAMVCIGLVFAFQEPGNPRRDARMQAHYQAQYDWDAVDSEVLMLSTRIRNTSAQLNRTAVYSGIDE